MASATSYFDLPIGNILKNIKYKKVLFSLISELKNVADAIVINLADDITIKIIEKISSLPFESTSSMHSNFQPGKKTEVESLTGFVTRLAKKLNVSTPAYDIVFSELKTK